MRLQWKEYKKQKKNGKKRENKMCDTIMAFSLRQLYIKKIKRIFTKFNCTFLLLFSVSFSFFVILFVFFLQYIHFMFVLWDVFCVCMLLVYYSVLCILYTTSQIVRIVYANVLKKFTYKALHISSIIYVGLCLSLSLAHAVFISPK